MGPSRGRGQERQYAAKAVGDPLQLELSRGAEEPDLGIALR